MPSEVTQIWNDARKGLEKAVQTFWQTRDSQGRKSRDRAGGTRGAVTGGQQMAGFAEIMRKIATRVGIPEECVFLKRNEIPGYFRPTKNWDLLIMSPEGRLIASLEFKSQVGSFGNNLNNRVEEALGNAVDINTAYREGAFGTHEAPWLGYLILAEKSTKSNRPVGIREPHFKAFGVFHGTSYLDRYGILCSRLVLERHYNSACPIWTSRTNGTVTYGDMHGCVSFEKFVRSYAGFLIGKTSEFVRRK